MRARPVVTILAIAALIMVVPHLSSRHEGARGAEPTKVVTIYTCCTDQDIDTVRHPGETVRIHWIPVAREEPVDRQPVTIVLKASLSEGYSSVRDLKTAESNSPTVLASAPPLTITGARSKPPVSTITIPRTATPGLYNLTTTRESGGGSVSGGSIIRVAVG